MELLDTHTYDGKCDKTIFEYINKVNFNNNPDKHIITLHLIEQVKHDVYNTKKNKSNYDPNIVINGVMCFKNNDFDPRNNIDTDTVFCIAWELCKANNEEDLFFLQMIDMITTSGSCVQGRVNRCLQIILALKSDN